MLDCLWTKDNEGDWQRIPVQKVTAKRVFLHVGGNTRTLDRARLESEGRACMAGGWGFFYTSAGRERLDLDRVMNEAAWLGERWKDFESREPNFMRAMRDHQGFTTDKQIEDWLNAQGERLKEMAKEVRR